MKYEVTEIGGDPEFGEPGFVMIHPRGQRQYQFEEVIEDYEPAEGDALLEETLIEVRQWYGERRPGLSLGPRTCLGLHGASASVVC